jgi:hypothetical protein
MIVILRRGNAKGAVGMKGQRSYLNNFNRISEILVMWRVTHYDKGKVALTFRFAWMISWWGVYIGIALRPFEHGGYHGQ